MWNQPSGPFVGPWKYELHVPEGLLADPFPSKIGAETRRDHELVDSLYTLKYVTPSPEPPSR